MRASILLVLAAVAGSAATDATVRSASQSRRDQVSSGLFHLEDVPTTAADETLARKALRDAEAELSKGLGDPEKVERMFDGLPQGAQTLIATMEAGKETAHWWWWYRYAYHRGARGSRGPSGGWGQRGWGGVMGHVGPAGAPGPRGPAGGTNAKGVQGPIGLLGVKGYPGTPGVPGHRGRQGSQGRQGVRGPPGPNYRAGGHGVDGPAGDQGVPGLRGDRGGHGTDGDAGQRGPVGHMGRRGPGPGQESGPAGPKGSVGTHGVIGPEGLAGPEGDPNPIPGFRGDMGPKGTLGPSGPAGPRGTIGEKGRPATHMKGVRGLEGNQGPLGYPGTLGGPGLKGINGPTGPRGRRGPTGSAGVPGPSGVRGVVGHSGPQGEQGSPGSTGPRGAKGSIGPKGKYGPRGAQGSSGPAGEMGGDGAKGRDGDKGKQGKRGPFGVAGVVGPMGPDGKRGRLGRRGVDGEPGAPGPAGPAGRLGPVGYRGAPGEPGPVGLEGTPGQAGNPGQRGPKGATGDRGLAGEDSTGSAFARLMTGQWIDKHAIFKTETRARVFSNGIVKFSRGRRKHEKLFGIPLVGADALRKDRHYTVKLRIAAVDLTENNSLFVGLSDGEYMGGFLRTASGDDALGRVLVGNKGDEEVRYEVVHDTRDQWGMHSEGETGWYEAPQNKMTKPVSLEEALAKGLVKPLTTTEAHTDAGASTAAGHPSAGETRQELENAAQAALAVTSSVTGGRKLLADADADADTTVIDDSADATATDDASVTVDGANYEDRLREAVRGPDAFGPPDEAKVKGGAFLPASAATENENVPKEWTDGEEEKSRLESNSPDGQPDWKQPHTGWLSRGKLKTYAPRWFEVYVRFDTSERTSVMARTNSAYVPVLADLPFKMDPSKGLSLAVFAADPAEEYGIFAIDAYIIEETP